MSLFYISLFLFISSVICTLVSLPFLRLSLCLLLSLLSHLPNLYASYHYKEPRTRVAQSVQ
jgi:hypothetical protein